MEPRSGARPAASASRPTPGGRLSPALAPLPPDVPPIIAFDAAEYARRLSNVRANMAERDLDALLIVDPSNVFYLTGSESQGAGHLQGLLVLQDANPCLVTWEFERGSTLLTSRIEDIVTYGWFDDPVERLADTMVSHGLSRARLGIELRSRSMSAATFAALEHRLPDARFEDSHGVVERCRLTKSPAELTHIRAAAAMTDRAVAAAYAMIAPGLRDGDIAATISASVYSAGSETVCWGPVVATGYGAGLMHTSFHGRVLRPGDTVFLELSGQVHHYVAPVMRTVFLGDPSPEVLAFRDAGMAALAAILAAARPGAIAGDVARAGAAELRPVIDRAFFHGLYGYSVGIGFPPSWYETLGFELRIEEERPLAAGMVFHVPLSLRKYAEFGVNQSQTIVVTETGAESVTRTPPELRVIRTT